MRCAAMLPALFVCLSTQALTACGSHGANYGGAAVAAGVAAAAAGVNRELTGDCWASCPPGFACDEASGTCQRMPCKNACPADSRCAIVDGEEQCVRSALRDSVAAGQGTSAPAAAEPDPCRGLCFRHEHCVAQNGVAECVPKPPP